uniref:Secreted protein n=1 Tax=Zea mays TaxID=4577 RepID=A0A804U8V4_MAIZE
MPSIVSTVMFSLLLPPPVAEQTVDGSGDEKADEPGIVVRRDKRTGHTRQNSNLVQKSRHDRRNSGRHCNHRGDVETALEVVRAAAVFGVERVDVQSGAPDNVVVGENNPSDGTHERRVTEKPGVDEALTGAEQPPRLEGNAEQRGDERPLGEREPPRAHANQRVRRCDNVGGDVGRDGCEADAEDGKKRRRRPSNAAEELDWVGYDVAEDGLGGRGDGEPGEGEHAHENWQPRLAEHLVRLAPRVPREVRYVDGHRRPEADVGCERREEDLPELCACQPRRQREDAAKPTGRRVGPGQQR